MEENKNQQKTAQILYITIILTLLVMALAVGLITAAGRRNTPVETLPIDTTVPATSQTAQSTVTTTPAVTTEKPAALTSKVPAATTEPKVTTTAKEAVATEPLPTIPDFAMPTIGNVSKTFTVDTLVYSNTMEDYRTHSGIDICASLGEAVMAAADGIVEEVYEHPMMGNTVVISHNGNAKTVYQSLANDIPVSVGDTVKCGEVIGAIGESALIEIAEEPHLHFEIEIDSVSVNPLDYISKSTMTIVYDE